jgi:uncharacterized integral membrane protein
MQPPRCCLLSGFLPCPSLGERRGPGRHGPLLRCVSSRRASWAPTFRLAQRGNKAPSLVPEVGSSERSEEAAVESRGQRLGRHSRRTRLYIWAFLLVALLVVLIVLIAKNTRSVKLDWAVGSTHASLVWIILAAAGLGWLLGIATSVILRYRTRSRVNS